MKYITSLFAVVLLFTVACTQQSDSASASEASESPEQESVLLVTQGTTDTLPTPEAEAEETAGLPAAQVPEPVSIAQKEATPKSGVEALTPAVEVSPSKVSEPQPEAKTSVSSPDKPAIKSAEPTIPVATKPVVAPSATISHDSWDQLLRKYVSAAGKVNYKGFKADKAALQAYLDQLSAHPPQSSWSRNERLAYWINVYNAFTVKLIVDNYPTSSITKLEGGKPWNKRWIPIGEKNYTLDEIENSIIRPRFKDARIHFAVNCASVSCPELLNRAFTASKLTQQLESQTRAYVNNPRHNFISASAPQVSQLFEWYAVDFEQKGTLVDFLNAYSKTPIQANASIGFKPYDWNLNE